MSKIPPVILQNNLSSYWHRRKRLRAKLHKESKLVSKESLSILSEFEKLEDEVGLK